MGSTTSVSRSRPSSALPQLWRGYPVLYVSCLGRRMPCRRWEEEFVGYAAERTAILICSTSDTSSQTALTVLRELRRADPALKILLLSPPGVNVWPSVQEAGSSWSIGVVQSVNGVFHIGMNLGGGGVCTPDGGKVELSGGREYFAAHIVLCQPDINLVPADWRQQEQGECGKEDSWLRCIWGSAKRDLCEGQECQTLDNPDLCLQNEIRKVVHDLRARYRATHSKLWLVLIKVCLTVFL